MNYSLSRHYISIVVAAVLVMAVSGCYQTMQTDASLQGRYLSSGQFTGDQLSRPGTILNKMAFTPTTTKVIIVSLILALMVAMIIGAALYYKVERQNSQKKSNRKD